MNVFLSICLTLCIQETFVKSEDPDEMHNAAFHQGLHFCYCNYQGQKNTSTFGDFATCDPLGYIMDNLIHITFIHRTLVKSAKRKFNFLISKPKHKLKLMGKKIFTILRTCVYKWENPSEYKGLNISFKF